jgi:hypothetical protein
VKITFSVQLLPGAKLGLQLSVSAKSPVTVFPWKFTVPAKGSLGSLVSVMVSGSLDVPLPWTAKSNPAPGTILSGLDGFAVSSTGKRPLFISQFGWAELPVHCCVFNCRK